MQHIQGAVQSRSMNAESLVEHYYDAVFRFCARQIGTDSAADAAQETFLIAYRKIANFRNESSLKTWLFGIAFNECRRLRRTKKLSTVSVDLIQVGDDPTQGLINRQLLLQALRKLSEDHREVVVLHELEGLTYEEVAKVLEVPVGTVKSRLYHAFLAMRRTLQEDSK
ncbi:MAG: RNA polymerase sigma factor [Armatimonadetes bacterium]|jgi:RNA polymerase sigma-70 factor (ECF subfamily)|nr:RNA polymerase sigma factor [Armatimonadota bacterium]